MVYFIIPYRPEAWQSARSDIAVEPREYEQSLMAEWSEAESYLPSDDSAYVLRWKILEDGETILFGGLQADLQTVSIEPANRYALTRFAIWHRTVIPSDQELYLTWEGVQESLEITGETTAEEIVSFTGLVA